MPKISIIIPVFNEENSIEEILKRVDGAQISGWEKEIIVVDDGSSDKTPQILRSLKNKISFKLINHSENRGKGSAIKTALNEAHGDYVLIQDADLEYNPKDYPELLRPIEQKKAEIVYGSRNLKLEKRGYFLNFWAGRFLTFLTNLFFGSNLTDINTGYKVFKTEILKNLHPENSRFEFCEEVTVKALKAGYKIFEAPISYNPRKIKEGKKLRWHDGITGFLTIVKLKFFK